MSRNVTVTGYGTARLAPDTAAVQLRLRARHTDYNAAAEALAKAAAIVEAAAKGAGVADVEVKAEAFRVDAQYVTKKDLAGNTKRVLAGYEASQTVRVSLPHAGANLVRVQQALQKCGADADLSVSYSLKDETAAKQQALEAACRDAKAKAQVMCAAMGVKLGQLVSANNSSQVTAIPVAAPVMLRNAPMRLAMDEGAPAPVEAEDIEVSADVTLVFDME